MWRKELPKDAFDYNSVAASPSIGYDGNIVVTTDVSNLDETVLYSKLYSVK
jgi:hypothetical protein